MEVRIRIAFSRREGRCLSKVPFNRPFFAGKELEYIAQAVSRGRIGGDGPFTRRCAELLQGRFGIGKVLMTPSCTAALEMAAVLCGLGPGDEVILPSFTFVSTAISERRRVVHRYYREHLEPLRAAGLLGLPHVPANCRDNTHLFYVILPDRRTRDDLLAYLRIRGIEAVFHYVPLHTSPMGARLGYAPGDLPITEDMAGRLLRLPLFQEITEDAQASVVEAIAAYFDWGQPEGHRDTADGTRIPRRRPRTSIAGIG